MSYVHIHLFSNVLHRRRRVSPRRPMYLLIVGSHYCVVRFAHLRQQNLVLFPSLYIELFELVIEVIFHSVTAPRLPATKLICSNVHSGVAALSAPMMLVCCSLASSSFTLRKSLFLSDDRLNSRMYSVRCYLLITMPSGLRFQKRFS